MAGINCPRCLVATTFKHCQNSSCYWRQCIKCTANKNKTVVFNPITLTYFVTGRN